MSTAPIPNFALASFSQAGSFADDALLSDGHHVVSRIGSVASGGGKINRGTIVKMVPATGVITLPAAAADCNAVVAENCDATSATVACLVYVSGKMKADRLIWPAALAHADVADALRNWGILVESVLFTDGLIVKASAAEVEATQAAKDRIQANKDRIKEAVEELPDLPIGVSESSWGYLTEKEKQEQPQLADPIRETGEDDEETATSKSQLKPQTQPRPPAPAQKPPEKK